MVNLAKKYLAIAVSFLVVEIANADFVTVSAVSDTFITSSPWDGDDYSIHGSDSGMNTVNGFGGFVALSMPLIRFDLSRYAGGTVNVPGEVRLELTGANTNTEPYPSQIIHIAEPKVAWNEDSTSFANFGGAGWFNYDLVTSDITSQTVTWHGVPEAVSFIIPSSVMQDWIDNPLNNNGLILMAGIIGAKDFGWSTKEGVASPTLSFTVTSVPLPAAALLFCSALAGLGIFGKRRAAR